MLGRIIGATVEPGREAGRFGRAVSRQADRFTTGSVSGTRPGGALLQRQFLFLLQLAFALLAVTSATRARATLGESVESVESVRRALSAAQRATIVQPRYTVHEFESGAAAVREFVSPSGTVFGIVWRGLAPPDSKLLLGSYEAEYQQALRQTPLIRGRRSLRLVADRVVVERWGHMRDLRGRAYAPALFPPGVTVDDLW